VLGFLSRKAVIPKYGFPVDVVELDTQRVRNSAAAFEVSLQRDLSIAIAEFAPTSQLVANKKLWSSYGLKKVAEREWPRRLYKKCAEHQMFWQWNQGEEEPPTSCGHTLPVHEYVVPIFGFVTNRDDKPGDPAARPSRVFSTRPYFVRPLNDQQQELKFPAPSPLLVMQRASPGVMVVLCEGRRGEGFFVCSSCGAGFRKRPADHKTPYGSPCSGMFSSVSLGHEFVTDVLRLQFLPKAPADFQGSWFAYSLVSALVEGAAEVLEVPPNDLNATVISEASPIGVPPIVLYDNVPGGAGIVARLEQADALREAFEAAYERLNRCDCGEKTSCYGCLRSYRNQFAHPHLQRGPVLRYLQQLLSQWL